MPSFMILLLENERAQQQMTPYEMAALIEDRMAYVERLKASGAYRDGERFRPSGEGKRVSAHATTEGPFDDERAIAGYYLIEAATLEAAVQLAKPCPLGPGDAHDVRPVMAGHVRASKTDLPGKTFALAVLGNAPTEASWVQLMDRIDGDTRGGFPDDRFLGGVRLEAPGRGRHIVPQGQKTLVIDGPFLESKEVIGGVFFMRMHDLDEAAQWAQTTKFMKYGTLEVRELWRT